MNFKDRQGREVVIGSRVAYNLSGEVALGAVEKITAGKKNVAGRWPNYQVWPVIHIRADAPWQKLAAKGGVSKVTVNDKDMATKLVVLDA